MRLTGCVGAGASAFVMGSPFRVVLRVAILPCCGRGPFANGPHARRGVRAPFVVSPSNHERRPASTVIPAFLRQQEPGAGRNPVGRGPRSPSAQSPVRLQPKAPFVVSRPSPVTLSRPTPVILSAAKNLKVPACGPRCPTVSDSRFFTSLRSE